ncbi:MAG: restriction endonuclease, partial [Luteibacter sp.]
MPWDEFERLIGEHYASRGYRVEHSGTGASGTHRKYDGGIDLKLFRGDEYIVVQCKRENVFQVTHNVVHELIGVMHTQGATGAIVVNAGEYSVAAKEAAAKFPQVELIDGLALRRMLAATGHMPVDTWADDVLTTMAGTAHRSGRRTRHARTPRFSPLTKIIAALFLALGFPAFVALIFIPAVLKATSESVLESTQHMTRPRTGSHPSPVSGSASAPGAVVQIEPAHE